MMRELTTSRVETPMILAGLCTPAFFIISAAMGTVEFTGFVTSWMTACRHRGQTTHQNALQGSISARMAVQRAGPDT